MESRLLPTPVAMWDCARRGSKNGGKAGVHARGLGATGAAIGVSVALAESTLFNYANDGASTLVGSAEGRQLNDAERAVARESLQYPHDSHGPSGLDHRAHGLDVVTGGRPAGCSPGAGSWRAGSAPRP